MSWLEKKGDGVIIRIRLSPRSHTNAVAGIIDDAVKIRLQAPPVDGKANKALIRFVAKKLKLPSSRIVLLSGQTSRSKRLAVSGMDVGAVEQRLLAQE